VNYSIFLVQRTSHPSLGNAKNNEKISKGIMWKHQEIMKWWEQWWNDKKMIGNEGIVGTIEEWCNGKKYVRGCHGGKLNDKGQ
jgi:hypothetical protein